MTVKTVGGVAQGSANSVDIQMDGTNQVVEIAGPGGGAAQQLALDTTLTSGLLVAKTPLITAESVITIAGANAPLQLIDMDPSAIGTPPTGFLGSTLTPGPGRLQAPHQSVLFTRGISAPVTANNTPVPVAVYGTYLQFLVIVSLPTGTTPTLTVSLDAVPILTDGTADQITAVKNFLVGALWSKVFDKGTAAGGTTVYPAMYIVSVGPGLGTAPSPVTNASGTINFVNVSMKLPLYVQVSLTVGGTTPSFATSLSLLRG